jgi:hypothetical protein
MLMVMAVVEVVVVTNAMVEQAGEGSRGRTAPWPGQLPKADKRRIRLRNLGPTTPGLKFLVIELSDWGVSKLVFKIEQ